MLNAQRRLAVLAGQIGESTVSEVHHQGVDATGIVKVEKDGKAQSLLISDGVVGGDQLRKALGGPWVYDPGLLNTAVARSRVCYIDGDKGILQYRGYPIEVLAEKSSFMEVSFLLINGELPSKRQLDIWNEKIMGHTFLHQTQLEMLKNFRFDAHPMGMIISAMGAMSTYFPDANPALAGADVYRNNEKLRNKQIYRILGKLPTIAACAYRHRIGRPYNDPVSHLSYTGNLLYMMDRLGDSSYEPHPVLAKALDVLFVLHAEHELNASTAAMRHLASTLVDPYSCVAGAAAALYGPLHGGANEAVVRMLMEIGSVDNVPAFISGVKAKTKKLMGFGHRVYKNYDPRAKIIRRVADDVFAVVGRNPLIDVALELERLALADEYFVTRKLYPNVDFFSGMIYQALGFPLDMFPVLFTLPRAAGWLAHWVEQLDDPETKLYRPRQVYIGYGKRDYLPVHDRSEAAVRPLDCNVSRTSLRRAASFQDQRTLRGWR
eukprot:TRINITY_DN6680_c0_g1_i1.p1 TRINITY_DN6680_c0_g1~~TRINITY_DN6680_c0_g1_i1.p1  ORF type:complete len:491 (-),score=71.95 TRINITY_DN6680_c0_g1_i1:757-2229(-)